MATTYLFLTPGNIDAALSLVTPEILAEVRDDFGVDTIPSKAQIKSWVNDPNYRLVGAQDTGTPQGFGVGNHLVDGRWQVLLVVVLGSLPAAQRGDIFRGMMRFVSAPPVPGGTRFMGIVPEGRRLDLLLQARGLTDRQEVGANVLNGNMMVEYNTTATEMQALL